MALKKSIYQFIILALVVVATDQLLGLYLEKKYKNNECFYANGEINDFIKNKNCDTLFIGSSRVLHLIDPAVIGPNCLNLAKQKKHNYYQTAIVDILEAEGKLPTRLLVLNIEIEDLFGEKREELIDQVLSLKYYYNSNKTVKGFIDEISWQERIKFISKTYRFNSYGLQLITNPFENVCPNYPKTGYIPLHPTKNDSARLAQSLIDDFKPIHSKSINTAVFQNILNIKKTCDKHEISFKVIDAPYHKVHPEYAYVSKLLSDYCDSIGVEFIDFKYMEIPGLENKTMWYDNMHTNASGSKIYSHFLKTKI